MKKSGYKMKGYSYPGTSPLKQSKFPSKPGESKLDKFIKKVITPKITKEDYYQDKQGEILDNLLPEVPVSPWPDNTAKVDLSNKLKVDPKINNETNIKNRINKFHRLSKTKTITENKNEQEWFAARGKNARKNRKSEEQFFKGKKKDRQNLWDNEFLRDVAVASTVNAVTRKKEKFVPVNIAGKQNKIM